MQNQAARAVSTLACETELQPQIVQASGITKQYEVREAEDFTEEWVKDKLGFFS